MSSTNGSARAAHAIDNRAKISPNLHLRPDYFGQISTWMTRVTGGKWAFLVALGTIIIWAVTGPIFKYSDTWQLVINTATTIVTFLMVFLIQNSQNREMKALHIKLDELIHAVRPANNEMINIENLTEDQLNQIAERYHRIAAHYHAKLEQRLATGQAAACAKDVEQTSR